MKSLIFSLLFLVACMTIGTAYAQDSFGGSDSFSSGGYDSFGGSDSFGGGYDSFSGGYDSFGGSDSFGSGDSFGGYGNSYGGSGDSFSSNSPPASWDNGKSWIQDGKEKTYNINGITKEGFTKEQVYEKAHFNSKYGVTYNQIHYGYPIYHTYWGYGGYHYASSDWLFHWYMWTLFFNQQEANQQKHLEQLALNNNTNVQYDMQQHKYVSGK